MSKDDLKLQALQASLADIGKPWEAGETSMSALTSDEQRKVLGYTPGPGDPSLEEAAQIAHLNYVAFEAAMAAGTAFGAPAKFDLRNVGGKNFVTPVKHQGGCGSCVAFGAVATVETTYRVQRNEPTFAIDLSEAHLFYCHARSEGRRCGGASGGWWPANAFNAFRDKGVVDDACYPYTDVDQACSNLCADSASRLWKIKGWKRLTKPADMKEWLATKGALSACFTVYSDFFNYKSGVYKRVSGANQGGHCVCVVGYDDAGKYWICKNSWGTGWGDGGYFKIAYGEVGIDAYMDAAETVFEPAWQRDKRITGLFATRHTRNAWAYVKDLGWRKVSNKDDSVFHAILTQLAAAKAANRRVDIRQDGNVIVEVYVF